MLKTPLQQWITDWKDCVRCPLHKTRTQVVHGRGTIPADRLDLCDVLFIGDAPGDSEDTTGQPFSGPAGFLFDDIVRQSVPDGIRYAVTDLTGCVPRTDDGIKAGQPDHDEIMACRPRLERFIELCDPQLIVMVGKLAEEYMEQGLTTSIRCPKTVPIISITHPSAIHRMPYLGRGLAVRRCVVTVAKGIETHVVKGL